ncbi:MAG: Bcr/CflA family drug resistance efflux transporter, partial [Oceanospirillum sp.]|nr:Bcr/CflA family drug resistance efflux transporter [Oceanospirillum sp.]
LGNGLSLFGAGLLLLFALEGQLSLTTLFLPMALVTFGRGFSQPNAQSGAIACATGSAGTASGLMGFIQLLTGGVMAQVTPWLMQQGLVVLMSCILAAPMLAICCHSYSWRRRRQKVKAAANI